MKTIKIREVKDQEKVDVMHTLNTYAFRESPPLVEREKFEALTKARKGTTVFCLFENDFPAATSASTRMIQNVRGKLFGASGIWGVATGPQFRREGYSRQVLKALLEANHLAGSAFSTLYPFRGSFYERLGYVTFPVPKLAKFKPENLSGMLKKDLDGTVEIVPIAEGYDIFRNYVEKVQKQVHGMALFDHPQKERTVERNNYWVATAKVDGKIEGLMLYDLRGDEVMSFKFGAARFYYESGLAKYLLLQWIARHIDQANEVEIRLAANEHPETWWADLRPNYERMFFAPMGRVLDISKIGGMQIGPGKISISITDPICPWNEGVWSFENIDGILKVNHGGDPECVLTIQGVSTLVYGMHDPDDFHILGWGSPDEAAQRKLLCMFPRLSPHLHEVF